MLRALDDGLWVAEMPASKLGFQYGARMTVVRLPDQTLFVHSPIALTRELRSRLEALGQIRHVVSPARFHVDHMPEFAKAYPAAMLYGVSASARRLGSAVHILRDAPPPAWEGAMEQSVFRGSRLYDEADFYHPATRTLILTDLCFNISRESSWSTRLIAKGLGVLGRLSASRSFRLTIRSRRQVRHSLHRLAAWDFDRVILSHGEIVERGGHEAFRAAFDGLL